MPKEEKTRTFESELLALPPLKMILVHSDKDQPDRATKKAKKIADKELREETVMRIIGKLSMKE
jgi:hypothetical protein